MPGKELNYYKREHSSKQKQLDELSKELRSKVLENKELTSKILELDRISLEQNVQAVNVNKHRLAWHEITNEKTKRRRMRQYKVSLFKAIDKILPGSERMTLCASVNGQQVKFEWSNNELTSQEISSELPSSQESSEHNYSSQPDDTAEHSQQESSFDLGRIFDKNGKYLPRHKQGIIHVMDNFRISKLAYHELYMQSEGYLPSISQILKERKKMSEAIPYKKHETVLSIKNLFWRKF